MMAVALCILADVGVAMALIVRVVFLTSFFLGLNVFLPSLVGSLGFMLGVLLDFLHLVTAVFLDFLHIVLSILVDIGVAVMLVILGVSFLSFRLVLYILLPGNIGAYRLNLFFGGKSGTCQYCG